MTSTIIKYFVLVFCCVYVYEKLLNLQPTSHLSRVWQTIFALLSSAVSYFLRTAAPPLTVIFLTILLVLFIAWQYKTPPNLSVSVTIISLAVCYAVYSAIVLLVSPIGAIFLRFIGNPVVIRIMSSLLSGVTLILLLQLLFQIKRLKAGMPFLRKYGNSDVGAYISVSLLLATLFLYPRETVNSGYAIPTLFLVVGSITIFAWWRRELTKTYLDRKLRKEYEEKLAALEAECKELRDTNRELASLIHRDNKLLPAMVWAVRSQLERGGMEAGEELLGRLDEALKKREGVLLDAGKARLPSTNVPAVDDVLGYLCRKAEADGVSMELWVRTGVRPLADYLGQEQTLTTLLADLVENARIATLSRGERRMLIIFELQEGHYAIEVLDSGEPFPTEVLCAWGLRQITGHPDEGGSGIGLMTTANIARQYNASFVIEEYPENVAYTKKVAMVFDGLGQYRVRTTPEKQAALRDSGREVVLL